MSSTDPSPGTRPSFMPKPVSTDDFLAQLQSPTQNVNINSSSPTEGFSNTLSTPGSQDAPAQSPSHHQGGRQWAPNASWKPRLPEGFNFEKQSPVLDDDGWPTDGSAIVASPAPPVHLQSPNLREHSPMISARHGRLVQPAPVQRPPVGFRYKNPDAELDECGWPKDGSAIIASSSPPTSLPRAPVLPAAIEQGWNPRRVHMPREESNRGRARTTINARYSSANRKGKEAAKRMQEIMGGPSRLRIEEEPSTPSPTPSYTAQDREVGNFHTRFANLQLNPPLESAPSIVPESLGTAPITTPQELEERKARKVYYLTHRDEFYSPGLTSKMHPAEREEIRDAILDAIEEETKRTLRKMRK